VIVCADFAIHAVVPLLKRFPLVGHRRTHFLTASTASIATINSDGVDGSGTV
jgi:hypothetical protein